MPTAAACRPPPTAPLRRRPAAQVTEGSGRMLVLAVGEQSEWGRTMALVVGEVGETPLQEKLGWLATAIGKLGFIVALICFFVLLIRYARPAPQRRGCCVGQAAGCGAGCGWRRARSSTRRCRSARRLPPGPPAPRSWIVQNKGFPMDQFSDGPLQFFIFAVTILVRPAGAGRAWVQRC